MSGPGAGYEILGAVKVKDGLFIGDELAAQDLEFVVANKVTRVINCCGRQVPNHWETIGVVYLTYYWVDADNQIILDQRDVVANEIFRFVEQALEGAESVLIHSVRGQSRSCCVLSAYMMKKYNWSLRKTMEFLSSRRPDLDLKPGLLQQLSSYERRLAAQAKAGLSSDWGDISFGRLECEDLLLRNTYINSQMGPLADFQNIDPAIAAKSSPRLLWADGSAGDQSRLEKPAGPTWNFKRNGQGQPVPICILKKPKGAAKVAQEMQGGTPRSQANGELLARPLSARGANQDQAAAPPAHVGVQLGAPPPPQPVSVAAAAQAAANSAAAQYSSYRSVPQAWGAIDDEDPLGAQPIGRVGDPGPQHQDGYSQGLPQSMLYRGPATNIRDSLLSRQDSPSTRDIPGSRSSSRDASPKTAPPRDPSPKTAVGRRGESPVGRLNGGYGGPGGRPGPSTRASLPGGAGAMYTRGPVMSPASVNPQRNSSGPPGMGAFRSGGPVRAKADLLGGAHDPNSSMRRNRPSTAPPQRSGSGSRPSSPMGLPQRSAGGSRPPSPHGRAPSPGAPRAEVMPPNPYAQFGPGRRSAPSMTKRAPSPTPAFNRNPSPNKPRWRM